MGADSAVETLALSVHTTTAKFSAGDTNWGAVAASDWRVGGDKAEGEAEAEQQEEQVDA